LRIRALSVIGWDTKWIVVGNAIPPLDPNALIINHILFLVAGGEVVAGGETTAGTRAEVEEVEVVEVVEVEEVEEVEVEGVGAQIRYPRVARSIILNLI